MIQKNIYDYLYKQIINKQVKVGERLPTETQLAARFNTNRMNAHFAMKKLSECGLISRHRRSGSFVKSNTLQKGQKNIEFGTQKKPVITLVTSSHSSNIHWNEHTLAVLETALNENEFQVVYRDFPVDRKEVSKVLNDAGKQYSIPGHSIPGHVVFFSNCPINRKVLSDSSDLILNYPGEVFEVSCGNHDISEIPCHVITTDPLSEGMLAAQYLADKGFEEIAFVAPRLMLENSEEWWFRMRIEGIKRVLDNRGVKLQILPEQYNQETKSTVPLLSLEYASNRGENAAFIVMTDGVAADVIDTLKKNALIAGKDYSIVAFDNNPAYRQYNLTTVSPRPLLPGRILANVIIKNGYHTDKFNLSLRIKPEIIERSSVINQNAENSAIQ